MLIRDTLCHKRIPSSMPDRHSAMWSCWLHTSRGQLLKPGHMQGCSRQACHVRSSKPDLRRHHLPSVHLL